jgi:hypothetical protein
MMWFKAMGGNPSKGIPPISFFLCMYGLDKNIKEFLKRGCSL